MYHARLSSKLSGPYLDVKSVHCRERFSIRLFSRLFSAFTPAIIFIIQSDPQKRQFLNFGRSDECVEVMKWAEEPGPNTPIIVSAVPVEHQVTLRQIRQWVDTNAKSPREIIQKNRLKELLPHYRCTVTAMTGEDSLLLLFYLLFKRGCHHSPSSVIA